MVLAAKTFGLENPHQWLVCGEHNLKFPAWCKTCPHCKGGSEYRQRKVRTTVDVEVVSR